MRRSVHLTLFCPLLFVWPLNSSGATALQCPPVFNGKPLAKAEVFDGPIGSGQPQAPERNQWLINPLPRDQWSRYPPYYLICNYQRTAETVSVELHRNTRVCEPAKGKNVRCR